METVGYEEKMFVPPKFNLPGIFLKLIKCNRLLQKVVQSTYINDFMYLWIVKSPCKSNLALVIISVTAAIGSEPWEVTCTKHWQTRTNMKSSGLVCSVYAYFLICICILNCIRLYSIMLILIYVCGNFNSWAPETGETNDWK